jgi:hypothetical protein
MISLFLRKGAKFDFENMVRASDIKGVKWKKESKGS